MFKVLIFGGALLILALTAMVGLRSRRLAQALMVAVAVVLAFDLLLVVVLDHPYAGDVAVPSDAFSEGVLRTVP